MYSKAKINGHPIHPMFVAFPIALYAASFVGFLLYQYVSGEPFWFRFAYICNMAGLIMAVIAAIPGVIDFSNIPRQTDAKKRGVLHGLLNVIALVIFGVNAYLIRGNFDLPPADVTFAVILSAIGFAVTMAAGYHGYALIGQHKVGVELTPEQERIELARQH